MPRWRGGGGFFREAAGMPARARRRRQTWAVPTTAGPEKKKGRGDRGHRGRRRLLKIVGIRKCYRRRHPSLALGWTPRGPSARQPAKLAGTRRNTLAAEANVVDLDIEHVRGCRMFDDHASRAHLSGSCLLRGTFRLRGHPPAHFGRDSLLDLVGHFVPRGERAVFAGGLVSDLDHRAGRCPSLFEHAGDERREPVDGPVSFEKLGSLGRGCCLGRAHGLPRV